MNYLINNLIDGQYIDINSQTYLSSNLQNKIDTNIQIIMKVIMLIYQEGENDNK